MKGLNPSMKEMKSLRRIMAAMLLVLTMTMSYIVPASAATWSNVSIAAGQYGYLHNSAKQDGFFTIPANTKVTETIKFGSKVNSSVSIGFRKKILLWTSGDNDVKTGAGTSTISTSYTLNDATDYEFYIHNSSDSVKTTTSAVIKF